MAMNFEWHRWFTSVQSAYSICADKLAFQPAAFGHFVSRETLTPPALVALGQVRKGASLDFKLVEALENLRP